MAEPKPTPKLTAEQAAKLVVRPAAKGGGKPMSITADEVLSFRDYGERVVVVTKDGQKLTGTQGAK